MTDVMTPIEDQLHVALVVCFWLWRALYYIYVTLRDSRTSSSDSAKIYGLTYDMAKGTLQ